MNGISIALLVLIWFMAACSTEAGVWADDSESARPVWDLLLDTSDETETDSAITDVPRNSANYFQTFGTEPTVEPHQTTIGPLAAGVGVFMLSMLLTTSIRFRRRHQ